MAGFGGALAATGFVTAGLLAAFGFADFDAAAFLGAVAFFTEAGFLGEAAGLEEAALDEAFLAPVLVNTEVARGPFLSLYWDAESGAR